MIRRHSNCDCHLIAITIALLLGVATVAVAQPIEDLQEKIDFLKQIAAANKANFSKIRTWQASYDCEQTFFRDLDMSLDMPSQESPSKSPSRRVRVNSHEQLSFLWEAATNNLLVKMQEQYESNKLFGENGERLPIPEQLRGLPMGASRNMLIKGSNIISFFTEFYRGPSERHPDDPLHKVYKIVERPTEISSRIATKETFESSWVKRNARAWKLPHCMFSIGDGFVWDELTAYADCMIPENHSDAARWLRKHLTIEKQGGKLKLGLAFRVSVAPTEVASSVTTILGEHLLPVECTHSQSGAIYTHSTWKYTRDDVMVPQQFHSVLNSIDSADLVYEVNQTLTHSKMNEPLSSNELDLTELGFRNGDRLDDRTNGTLYVWLNEEFREASDAPLHEVTAAVTGISHPREKHAHRPWSSVYASIGVIAFLFVSLYMGKLYRYFKGD